MIRCDMIYATFEVNDVKSILFISKVRVLTLGKI